MGAEMPKFQLKAVVYIVTLVFFIAMFVPHCFPQYCRVDQRQGSQVTRTIGVTRGLAVNLTWYYSLHGCVFQEQRFGYDSTDGLESLAIKRQNGITEIVEGLKAHFSGRVTTSPLSNTLIIQNIQYNDSLYQFSSILSAQCVPIPRLVSKTLMPRFFLDVTGAPSYVTFPEDEVQVEEGQTIQIAAIAEARPAPLAIFYLSTQKTPNVIQPRNIYPFSYEAAFELKNISSHLCGSNVTTEFYNSRGSSKVRVTTIKVELHLSNSLGLAATFVNQTCIRITWKKKLSGACQIEYAIALYNRLKHLVFSHAEYNTEGHVYCNASIHQIEGVTLNVSYQRYTVTASAHVTGRQTAMTRSTSTFSTASLAGSKVSMGDAATPTNISPLVTTTEHVVTTSGDEPCHNSETSTLHQRVSHSPPVAAMATLGSIIFLLIVVVAVLIKWNQRLRSSRPQGIANANLNRSDFKQEIDTHYMSLKELVEKPTYTALADSEPKHESSKPKLYVNCAPLDETVNDSQTYENL